MIKLKTMKPGLKKALIYITIPVVLVGGYCYWTLTRQLSPIQPEPTPVASDVVKTLSKLVWPTAGESALGVLGSHVLQTHGPQTAVPTASTAKLITALVVLKDKPLALNQEGPTITLSASDVNIYNAYVAEQGSVVQVQAGEKISEYQMLEAMLLPSANNMADSLAIWAYGSLAAYSNAANTYLASLGLKNTHIGIDASGFSPTTVSSAADLVKIGELVMNDPILSGIVGKTVATGIPVVSSVKNVNYLLGSNGIVGIKTGNTTQAGGVFVGATQVSVNNKLVTIVTADMGAPTLVEALDGSVPLIKSARANLDSVSLVNKGQVLGTYKLPWNNQSVQAVANANLNEIAWGGSTLSLNLSHLKPLIYPSSDGPDVGQVSSHSDGVLNSQSVGVVLKHSVVGPSISWRLLHP